jgi:hypothetical protein
MATTAEMVKDIKETLTWGGRIIVGALIVATYNKVDADHDLNIRQQDKIDNHEQRIGELEKRGKQSCYIMPKLEAVLPEGIKEPKKETEE